MPIPRLTGPQRGNLQRAILGVYQGYDPEPHFATFLSDTLDEDFHRLAPYGVAFPERLSAVLARLNSEGKVTALLNALEARYPEATELRAEIRQLREAANRTDAGEAATRQAPFAWPVQDVIAFLRRFDLTLVTEPVPLALVRAIDSATPASAQRLLVIGQANEWLHNAGLVLRDIMPRIDRGLLPSPDGYALDFWLQTAVHAPSQGARVLMALLAAAPIHATRPFVAWIEEIAVKYGR